MKLNHDLSGAVSFQELNAMVRLGQRVELEAFFRQFLDDLRALAEEDLVMARSRLLSLVTGLVVSILELGAPPETERRIAVAAEEITKTDSPDRLMLLAQHYLTHMNVCARPRGNRYAVQIVERCKHIIAHEYGEDLSDENLADRMSLSRSHFRYLFREITGIPFKRYLSEVRLNAARTLLIETGMSVKEVCAEVGYADASSFYRAYRGYHGVPPSSHRNASV